ncbi:MAG: DUF2147 domain-containing protein [Pseudomonadota bacterium]
MLALGQVDWAMNWRPSFIVAALLALLPAVAVSATDPVVGYWFTENNRAIVQIVPCGNSVCGRMVWLKEPLDETGQPKIGAAGQPLCGYSLAEGFSRSSNGQWDDGNIRNPRNGKRYSALLRIKQDGRLEVRGYAGISLFGSSQLWSRARGDMGGCPIH